MKLSKKWIYPLFILAVSPVVQASGSLMEELDYNISQWRNAGLPEAVIQEEADKFVKLRSMSPEQRLDNVIRFKQGDPTAVEDIELAQDLATQGVFYLEGKYGKAVASYAYKMSVRDFCRANVLSNSPNKKVAEELLDKTCGKIGY